MRFTCFALDFDNCLAYYKDGRAGLYKIFTDIGFSEEEIKRAYDDVNETAVVSFESITSRLEQNTGKKIERIGLKDRFNNWINETVTLYADTDEFINKLRSEKYPVIIVTFGDDDFQTRKVEVSKIVYDELLITKISGEKFTAIHDLLKRYGAPVVFIDDKPEELDSVREHFSDEEVKLFRIIRPGGLHNHKQAKFEYPAIKDLEEALA